MSTRITPTEAQLSAANKVVVEHEQKSAQVPHSSILTYCIAQLIAESEARAVAQQTDGLCMMHADERDQLRAEVERLKNQIKDAHRAYGCELRELWEQAIKNEARAEKAEAEVERLTNQRDNLLKPLRERAEARAERAEAELATERARLDWLLNWNVSGHPFKTLSAIDAAMKEDRK
jgi:hypothetical protein